MTARDQVAVDIHCHLLVPEAAALVAPYFDAELDEFHRWSNATTRAYNEIAFGEIASLMTDPRRRLQEMDRMRIDVQAVSIAAPQYYYWTEP